MVFKPKGGRREKCECGDSLRLGYREQAKHFVGLKGKKNNKKRVATNNKKEKGRKKTLPQKETKEVGYLQVVSLRIRKSITYANAPGYGSLRPLLRSWGLHQPEIHSTRPKKSRTHTTRYIINFICIWARPIAKQESIPVAYGHRLLYKDDLMRDNGERGYRAPD
jgi:hypothetical protein